MSLAASLREAARPNDGGIGRFPDGLVLAGGLAEHLGALGDVEDVVDDLEGEAEGVAEVREGVRVSREWRWRSSRRGAARW